MFNSNDRIDTANPLPRHTQVRSTLRGMVTSGRLHSGDKIPAEVDIASALGVSKMTVNKAILALTDEGFFVREVGRGTFVADDYRADAPRRESLPRERTAHVPAAPAEPEIVRIALAFPTDIRNLAGDFDDAGSWSIYRGIADYAESMLTASRRVELVLTTQQRAASTDGVRAGHLQGAIAISPRARDLPAVRALMRNDLPVVVAGASWPGMTAPSVEVDHCAAAVEAVQHLIAMGHENIALLFAEGERATIQERVVGFRRALAAAHLSQQAAHEVWAEDIARAGSWARQRLVDLATADSRPVTAVFAASFPLALEAISALQEAGLRVPEDVSVVGTDDPQAARLITPALTTIRQPLYEMGWRAADRLLRSLGGEEPAAQPLREILPASLIVRHSSSAPAVCTPGSLAGSVLGADSECAADRVLLPV